MATKTVAEVLRAYRLKNGLTQLELAKKLGITRPYLNQLENELLKPGIKLLKVISDTTKTPIKDLI